MEVIVEGHTHQYAANHHPPSSNNNNNHQSTVAERVVRTAPSLSVVTTAGPATGNPTLGSLSANAKKVGHQGAVGGTKKQRLSLGQQQQQQPQSQPSK